MAKAKQNGDGSEFDRAEQAAKFIRSKGKLRPEIAVVLGSGLGNFADSLRNPTKIPYARIPHFPRSTAAGHAGELVTGELNGLALAVMQGRVHFYEGYTIQEITFPMRVLGRLGIRSVVLTNAAGGINPDYKQGALVILRDHINLLGANPLAGENDERFGARFPDMTHAYDRALRTMALEEMRKLGSQLGIEPREGVYAAVPGPSYETPAEIRFLRTIGADLVGMSTVPEVIAARHMSIRVLGISCVTNMAAGILDKPLDHREVLETGKRVERQFTALLRAILPRISQILKFDRGKKS